MVRSSWPIDRSSENSHTPVAVPMMPPTSNIKASAGSSARRRQYVMAPVNEEAAIWVVTLATREGIWPEASSVAPLAAIERLRTDGTIAPNERCVALLTASGLKDPGPIEAALPEPPLVSGGLSDLMAALRNSYGFAHG